MTPFEDYMYWDDQTQYPMTFIIELKLEGRLDRAALENALPKALARHPLLQAVIRRAKGNRDCWVSDPKVQVKIDWGPIGAPLLFAEGEAIDLRREPGVRLWVRYDDTRTEITGQFHHATTDGVGGFQFIGDWFWYYAENVGQPVKDPLPPASPKSLRARGLACYNPELYRMPNGKLRNDYGHSLRMLWERVAPVASPRRFERSAAERPEFPGIRSFEFNKSQHRQLRYAAEARGQTVNELLIEWLMLAMLEWNRRHRSFRGGSICAMMPMDLREADTPVTSAANIVTYAFIRRSPRELQNEARRVASLREEILKLKHQRHCSPLMNMLAGGLRHPRWLKRLLFSHRCLATAIISNLADPTKRFSVPFPREDGELVVGNLRLVDIRGVPPMRYGTRATLSVNTYRRVLQVFLRCDPHRFSIQDTQQLLDLYVSKLQMLLPDVEATPQPSGVVARPEPVGAEA
jgi:hypothetical protein